jgi:glycosyltransferase involved in cell wall biosynthesis
VKLALIVPGGVDRSGEVRVIPALLALIKRLASEHELHVFAMNQEPTPDTWVLEGARVRNIGQPRTAWRAALTIWAEHRKAPFQVLHAVWAGSTGAIAVGMGALLGVPSLVHLAGGELVSLVDIAYGGCRSLRGRVLQHGVVSCATRVTAASWQMCDLAARHGVRAQRLPLGVDLERWPPRLPLRRLSTETARLVHVASLNRVKDQTTLLQAMRLLADRRCDFRLDVVGEDTMGGEMQALAVKLGISPRVRFHGFLTQRELRPIVENAHVALISSRHEAGPLAVLEAAVAGVPTVGTAVGHIAEWAPAAASAVRCGDAAALADAVHALLEDDQLRIRMAVEALRRAKLEDADETARSFNAVYRELIARGAADVPSTERPRAQ